MAEPEKKKSCDSLFLGIDLGTTSVKVCLVNVDNVVQRETSYPHHADIKSSLGESGFEQDVELILATLQRCLEDFTMLERRQITKIGVTGQMHGIMFWSSKIICPKFDDLKSQTAENASVECIHSLDLQEKLKNSTDDAISKLFTWQDQRCTSDFLLTLPKPKSHLPLATGHGNATLFWLCRHQPRFFKDKSFDSAGTVMDFLVAFLCGLKKPLMTPQLAASWGYFDCKNRCWNKSILENSSFPIHLLPDITDVGRSAGMLQFDWLDIQAGTPVLAALGDAQCAVYSMIQNPSDAVLNMSTSCQLAFPVRDSSLIPDVSDTESAVQYFPYFEDGYLAIAASLNGGNVLTAFVNMLRQWMQCFDCNLSEDTIWTKIIQLSMKNSGISNLRITPTIFGERHTPEQRGQVTGVTSDNFDLESVFGAICRGLLDNLCNMMSPSFLVRNEIKRLIGTGSVISKNPLIRQEVASHYGKNLEVSFGDSCDSATGVAMYASRV